MGGSIFPHCATPTNLTEYRGWVEQKSMPTFLKLFCLSLLVALLVIFLTPSGTVFAQSPDGREVDNDGGDTNDDSGDDGDDDNDDNDDDQDDDKPDDPAPPEKTSESTEKKPDDKDKPQCTDGDCPVCWSKKIPFKDRFKLVMDDEAVLDRETGLVWQRKISGLEMTYDNATEQCMALEIGHRSGWRLPAIHELSSLQSEKSILTPDSPFQIDFQNGTFWSSTLVDFFNESKRKVMWSFFSTGGGYILGSKQDLKKDHYFICVRAK